MGAKLWLESYQVGIESSNKDANRGVGRQEFQMWSLKTSGMEALAGYWALENPVADRLKPRFRVHLDLLVGRC